MTSRFNRRRALAGFGSLSLASVLAACGADEASEPRATTTFDDSASCRLTAEQTEGPYYFDADAIRSDIREDRDGVPLRLAVRVRDARCSPIKDAVVDVWHCDAGGVYSGFEAGEGERFLRGTQVTNADGVVEFTTVYPGGYEGRTVHIHAKVHLNRTEVLTTQLYFDDAVTDRVFASAPYGEGERRRNDADQLFTDSLVLKLGRDGDGYAGSITFDVDRTAA